jgi:hypothetical protein
MLTDFQNRRTLGFPRQGECSPLIFSDPILCSSQMISDMGVAHFSPPSHHDRD